MNIWTVLETDEDGISTPFVHSYATEEAAISVITEYHKGLWAEGMEGEGELVILPTSDTESVITLANADVNWTSWTVTKTEVKG